MTVEETAKRVEQNPIVQVIGKAVVSGLLIVVSAGVGAVYDAQRDVEVRLRDVEIAIAEFRTVVQHNTEELEDHAVSGGHPPLLSRMNEVERHVEVIQFRLDSLTP